LALNYNKFVAEFPLLKAGAADVALFLLLLFAKSLFDKVKHC